MQENFADATPEEIDLTLREAEGAFHFFRKLPGEKRADLLEAIAEGLEENADEIVAIAEDETNLGLPRLKMELGRTIGETRHFAELTRSNTWLESRSDKAEPDRNPFPKPALQSRNVPLGPVVVIGACNFPIAISVVGTDTMSALAVGCPVIVKTHPRHPATCALLGKIVQEATTKTKMPKGTFAILHGENHRVTRELVQHGLTKAAAFTGSLKGGRALADIANARAEPIPFYAEMGSLNPLFVLPGALAERTEEIAEGYVDAVNLFAGQMCTKPGILVTMESQELDSFLKYLNQIVPERKPAPMLNADVLSNFEAHVATLAEKTKVLAYSKKSPEAQSKDAACCLFRTDISAFRNDPELRTEAFGPASLILKARDEQELVTLAKELEGSLTASLHVGQGDEVLAKKLLPILESKVGRILWNGFPPGVVPSPSTPHGGPWPATTDSRHTSIGLYGYRRFGRQVCRQGFPDDD